MDREICRLRDGQRNGWINGWRNGGMNSGTYEGMDPLNGGMYGWKEGQTEG